MKKLKLKYLLVSLIITIFLVVASGCELIPEIYTSTPTETPPPTTIVTPIDPEWTPPSDGQDQALPSIADVVALVHGVRPAVRGVHEPDDAMLQRRHEEASVTVLHGVRDVTGPPLRVSPGR